LVLDKTNNLKKIPCAKLCKQGCGSGSWKRKRWKRKHFEERSGSELGSIWLSEEPEAEALFIKHGASLPLTWLQSLDKI